MPAWKTPYTGFIYAGHWRKVAEPLDSGREDQLIATAIPFCTRSQAGQLGVDRAVQALTVRANPPYFRAVRRLDAEPGKTG
ncbi:MAG: hypothetical protein MJE77_44930 [Proteobacteria bacterium]|nr:hypothetical protein [Pseudomonadota bacterium]